MLITIINQTIWTSSNPLNHLCIFHPSMNGFRSTYVIPNILETLLGAGSIDCPITDFVINLRITESLPGNGEQNSIIPNILTLLRTVSHEEWYHAIDAQLSRLHVKKLFIYQSSYYGKKTILSQIVKIL